MGALREHADDVVRAVAAALANRYAIIRPIGAGGMATVDLATALPSGRPVAIKVLRPNLSRTVGAERFAREARLLEAFEHPQIVAALDSREADGHFWFAMPFIDGESLRQRITREGALPVDASLSIACPAFRDAIAETSTQA